MVAAGTLKGIAAGMMTKSAGSMKASGALGDTISNIGEQIQEQTALLNSREKVEEKLLQNQKDLQKVQLKMQKLQKMEKDQLYKFPGDADKAAKALKKLTEAERELKEAKAETNDEWEKTNKQINEFNSKQSFWASGAKLMIGKVAGIATAYFSWSKALDSVDYRLKMSSQSITDMGIALDGTAGGYKRIVDEGLKWNEAINDTVRDLSLMGMRADETKGIMTKLAGGLALTTAKQKDMIGMTQQMTKDIGFLSRLIGTSTEELADATVAASEKFGTSTKAMSQDMTQMYLAITQLRDQAPNAVLGIRQLTKQALNAQAAFQGYSLNLRNTASVMGLLSEKAQAQGASIQGATAMATQMFDLMTGQKAPDWAKYMAGDKLRKEVKKAIGVFDLESVEGMKAARVSLAKEMGTGINDLNDNQLKGLQDIANNWKEYGSLSAANMTQEMLGGTEGGMKAMMTLMQKTTQGTDQREMFKAIWGLDDQAATAAALAFKKGFAEKGGVDAFFQDMQALKQESEGRQPPTIDDVKKQTLDTVKAIGQARTGIMGTIAAYMEGLAENPAITGIIGALGAGASGAMQAVTSGAAQGVMGKLGGIGFGGAGLLAGSAKAVAAGGAGTTLAGAAGASGAATGAGGFAAVALPVALAGAVGVGIGSLLRLIPGVDSFAESIFNAHAKMLDLPHSMDDLEAAQAGLAASLRNPELNKSLQEQSQVVRGRVTDERRIAIQQRSLAEMSNEDLMARAKAMVKSDKMNKQLSGPEAQVEERYLAKLFDMREAGQRDKGKALPSAATPEAPEPAEKSKTEKTAKDVAKAVDVTKDTKADKTHERIKAEAQKYQKKAADVADDFWKNGMPKASGSAWKAMTAEFNATVQDMTVAYIASLPGGAALLEKMGHTFRQVGAEIRGGRGGVDAKGDLWTKVTADGRGQQEADLEAKK